MTQEKHYHTEHDLRQHGEHGEHGAARPAPQQHGEHPEQDEHHEHGNAGRHLRVGILTCSDRSARGERADVGGPTLHNLAVERLGARVAQYKVVPDDREAIAATLREWADERDLDLILTTGGTGFAPRDVTPEATRLVVERETPALIQAMVFESLRITPYAMLTRATAGIRGRTLIVNFPGSPKALTENFNAVAEVLPHAVVIVQGEDTHAEGQAGHSHDENRHGDQRAKSHDGQGQAAGAHANEPHAGHREEPAAPGAAGIARNVGGPPC